MGNVKGTGVDKDAKPMHDPVTVTVTPGGIEQDQDTWSDANNAIAAGSSFKDGYPQGPGEEPSSRSKASSSGGSGGSGSSGSSSS